MTDEVASGDRATGVALLHPFCLEVTMHPFDKYVQNVKKMVTDKSLDQSEYMRLGQSDLRWSVFRSRKFLDRKIKRGNVYQFDFGKNVVPEMSYEHRGLVIGTNKNLLYVLPIFTYRELAHKKDLFDPVSNKKGNLYMLHASEYGFINHDSVLKLNDIRCVSTKRILYKQGSGTIPADSDDYKNIEVQALARVFPEFHYELMQLRKEKQCLKEQLSAQDK